MKTTYTERLREKSRRRRKALILIGMLAFLSFIASTLFGDSGILVNMRVKQEYEKLNDERERLRAENMRLREEINALKSNPRKIEAISREEYGFGRPGEIIYYFPDDADAAIQKFRRPLESESGGSR